MTILKPNGDVITCTVEEYKQLYEPTTKVSNVSNNFTPSSLIGVYTTNSTLEDDC